MRHPGIAQVAVIGLPDELHGEEVCAVVVRAPGTTPDATPDAAAITEWSKQHLGRTSTRAGWSSPTSCRSGRA
ncbi:hypothetical protein STENM223S_02943 [Streptomyces tendae]